MAFPNFSREPEREKLNCAKWSRTFDPKIAERHLLPRHGALTSLAAIVTFSECVQAGWSDQILRSGNNAQEQLNSRPAEKHGKELLDQRRTALDAILPSRIRFLPLTAIERVNL
jgi:hypothetical protein